MKSSKNTPSSSSSSSMAMAMAFTPSSCSSSSSSSSSFSFSSPLTNSDPQTSATLSPPALLLHSSPAIRKFLSSAAASRLSLPVGLSESAAQYAEADVVPYSLIRDVWVKTQSDSRPRLRHLLGGTTFYLESPRPREKSEELKARLQKLQDIADKKAYDELVKDVSGKRKDPEYFSSYKDQLGLGLHVVVTMFTGYLAGYALFRSQFGGNVALHAAGGLLGLLIGMLVETLLFIIRSSRFEERSLNSNKVLDRKEELLGSKPASFSNSRSVSSPGIRKRKVS